MKPGDDLTVDLTVRFSATGKVNVKLPEGWQDQFTGGASNRDRFEEQPFLSVIPTDPEASKEQRQAKIPVRPLYPSNDELTLRVPSGNYTVACGSLEGNVSVAAGETVEVTLGPSS